MERVKIGIINDIHYEPFYVPGASPTDNCRGSTPFEQIDLLDEELSPFGVHG